MKDARQAGYEAIKALRVDCTNTSLIREGAKIKRNNTTGVRGVSWHGNNGYRAYMGFKGRTTYLGLYPTIEETAAAHREAEERIYGVYLEEREKGIT